jgi:hypothetical protein
MLDDSGSESHAGEAPRDPQHTAEVASDAEEIERIKALPKEVGVLLVVAGIGGLLLPGPVGSPFLVLGCAMLWPRTFQWMEDGLAKRFPRCHHQGVRHIKRFIDDLDRRYPLSK